MKGLVPAALLLFTASGARAAPPAATAPCRSDQSRVDVAVEGGPEPFREAVRAEVLIELSRQRLCTADGGPAPIARIRIALTGEITAQIRVDDAVTKKSVERAVDVGALPGDSRALSIAIAADELLRASWAEIALRRAAQPADAPVPQVVRASVEAAAPPPPPPPPSGGARPAFDRARPNEAGARASIAVYGGGQTHLGGALYLRRDLFRFLSAELHVYGREGTTVTAPDGTIAAHAFGGGASLDALFLYAGPARLGVRAGVEVGYVLFEGRATPPSIQASFGGVSCFGQLGLAGAVEVGRVHLSAAILALAPFRAIAALDGTETVTSAGGPGVQIDLGVGVPF